jgi:glycine oxidase
MASGERIAIVGAGIIGTAVAFELSRRGAHITVYDSRTLAAGATQASAGLLAPYTEAHGGGALFDLTVRGLDVYDGFVEDVRAVSPIAFEYRRAGMLEVADTQDRLEELRARVGERWAGRAGLEWLDPASLRTRAPSVRPDALGALWCAVHGHVAVPAFVDAIADAARRSGAAFEFPREVTAIEPSAGAVTVVSGDQSQAFDRVVLCAGAWAPALDPLGRLKGRIMPIRGQLVRLAAPHLEPGHPLWGGSCYIVPWADGTLLVGATSEDVGFDERATLEGVRQLLVAAEELVPALTSASFQGVRVGLRPGTADGLPILGPSSDPRILYAAGHFRNGILLAPITAQLVATYVFTGVVDPAFSAA